MAERAASICAELSHDAPINLAALELLSKWRNVVVHGDPDAPEDSNRPPEIDSEHANTLRNAASQLHASHAHIDIALALKNFSEQKIPLPKETTTLVALVVRLAKDLDAIAITRLAGSQNSFEKITDELLRRYFNERGTRKISSWSEISNTLQGDRLLRLHNISKILANIGISMTETPASASLSPEYLEQLQSMTRDEFAERFGVVKV